MDSLTAGMLFWIAAAVGHLGVWCWVFNRAHATAFPRSWRKALEKLIAIVVLIPPCLVLLTWWRTGSLAWQVHADQAPGMHGYLSVCALTSIYFVGAWMWRSLAYRVPNAVTARTTQRIDVARELSRHLQQGFLARAFARVPGNQVTQLSIEEAELNVLAPDSPIVGLRICHLSDFHFTGALDRAYFEYVVSRANQWRPDLIVLTGDFVDEQDCVDWVQPILGALHAPLGKFYVLGNHDRRIANEQLLRDELRRANVTQASGRWNEVWFNGGRIAIAGNELPWYRLPTSPRKELAASDDLIIALMHSPDQRRWAEAVGAHLAFAGHLHGGQICLPLIGAMIAPSKYGVRYVPEFHATRTGLMIVNRGLSGDEPIRLLCPPHMGCYRLGCQRIAPSSSNT